MRWLFCLHLGLKGKQLIHGKGGAGVNRPHLGPSCQTVHSSRAECLGNWVLLDMEVMLERLWALGAVFLACRCAPSGIRTSSFMSEMTRYHCNTCNRNECSWSFLGLEKSHHCIEAFIRVMGWKNASSCCQTGISFAFQALCYLSCWYFPGSMYIRHSKLEWVQWH